MYTCWIRALLCAALLLAHGLILADEAGDRAAIRAEIRAAFDRGDFALIETRFAELHGQDQRMPSGITKASQVLYALEAAVGSPVSPGRPEAQWKLAEDKAAQWQRAYPSSSLAVFAATHAHIGHGFFHRGNRMAVDVLPEKWPLFHAELKKASDALLAPDTKVPRDAVWYTAMLQLAQYQSVDLQAYARFVDEATTKWPNFYELYFVAAGRMQPRWGGSTEAFEWLANMAAEKTRATDGMALYARVYWGIAQSEGMHNLFDATRVDWKKMKAGFDDIVKRYPESWNYNHYAWFACLARDAAATKSAFDKVGGELNAELWQNRQWLNRCRTLARDGE